MKKSAIFWILLTTSQFSYALSEEECLIRNVYLEARSLSKDDWKKVASVALSRKKAFKTYRFGARTASICSIVTSRQYSTRNLLSKRIKEVKIFEKIKQTIKGVKPGKYLFFTSRNGKHIYH